ncbi:potassium channel family protein [Microbacterium maritypicum]|uniref:potassium channel family protein n=1 Tax=Microbacterium maritypicum TaxID=33918 RepID=UPI00381C80BF
MRTVPSRESASSAKNAGYEVFIGALSLLSVVNLFLGYVFVNDSSLQQLLLVMNGIFSAVFLGDFLYKLMRAPSRGAYFLRLYGWADLLASLPFPQVKVLRLFRLVRVIRLLRDLGPARVWAAIAADRGGSTLLTLLLIGVLVLQFGSLGILAVEHYAPGSHITTPSDALWYTLVTISTVGYGDLTPVTDTGRLIGSGIIILGVGIFGTFAGYLANTFVQPSPRNPNMHEKPLESVAAHRPAAATETITVPTRNLEQLLAQFEITTKQIREHLGRDM